VGARAKKLEVEPRDPSQGAAGEGAQNPRKGNTRITGTRHGKPRGGVEPSVKRGAQSSAD